MPGKIFINYRRDDDPNGAARICDGLAKQFGRSNVFMDVDNLLAGQKFHLELTRALDACDVFIAVIGSKWLQLLKDREASGEEDYVRLEIAAALKRDLAVIPVRVGREGQLAVLPRRIDLPEDIQDLVSFQKHDVAHERYGRDMADLVAAVASIRRRGGTSFGRRFGRVAGIGAGLVAVAGLTYAGAQQLGFEIAWPWASGRVEPAPARVENAAPPVPSGASITEPINWKMATGFLKSAGGSFEAGENFARRLAEVTSGTARIQAYAAGVIVPAGQVLDVVSAGTVEAGWTVMSLHADKEPAFKFISGRAPLGLDANGLVRWAQSDSGSTARDVVFEAWRVKGMACALDGAPGLWSKRRLTTADDLNGMKVRALGTQGSIVQRLGASRLILPIGDVVPALERGVIDGVIDGAPEAGLRLGLQHAARFYHAPVWDQSGVSLIDLIISRPRWDALSKGAQNVIAATCREQLLTSLLALPQNERSGREALSKAGVQVLPMPSDIVERARQAGRAEIEADTKASVLAKRVWDSLSGDR